ncbi:MAG: hypothetical protein HGA85_01720, partial [Nanoarchaeota archaeon]|nr:hypothetical protein [Nanoarchaeota archaeon]
MKSHIFSIISTILAFACIFFFPLSLLFGVVGVGFGLYAISKKEERLIPGLCIAGSIVAIVISSAVLAIGYTIIKAHLGQGLGVIVPSVPELNKTEYPGKTIPGADYGSPSQGRKANRTFIPEVSYMLESLKVAEKKGWDGKSELPLKKEDLSPEYIEKLQKGLLHQEGWLIPQEHVQAYLSKEARESIYKEILAAREEYLDYLKKKEVLQKYIDEIEKNTLPEDPERIVYHDINRDDVPQTAVQGDRDESGNVIGDDYSRLELNIYPADIYNGVKRLNASGIITGEKD